MKSMSRVLFCSAVVVFALVAVATTALPQVLISQIYGGGGNSGATYTHDFIELANPTLSAVSLDGWSVQYAAATGTSWSVTALSGSIPALGHYLIQQAQGSGGTVPLPTPDATGTIAMSATTAKVALCNSTTPLTGACPTGGSIIDFAGYGTTANCYEGSGPTPAPSNTTAAARKWDGALDTDNNANDFEIFNPPLPRNSSNPPLPVQLASFTGRVIGNNYVRLDWRTISEINNYGFYVQKRIASLTDWIEIENSFLPGHGTTNEPQHYTFTDHTGINGPTQYRLKQVDLDGRMNFSEPIVVDLPTSVAEIAPKQFALEQNYPNPFNPSTEIKFSVENTGRATLEVYNTLGQQVATLFDGIAEAGEYYRVPFHASSLASGVYLYRLQSGERYDLKRMLLLK